MKRQHVPMYALALALVVVGALAAGVPGNSLLFGLVLLACPLMMLFMHGGHGGHGGDGAAQKPDQSAGTADTDHMHPGASLRR